MHAVELRLGHKSLRLGDNRLAQWDKTTNQIILNLDDGKYFRDTGSFHGVMLYSHHRGSHIIPVCVITNEGNISSRWMEIFPEDRFMLRAAGWLSKLSKLAQVPAADCLERFLRTKIMTTEDWEKSTEAQRLANFELVLNQMDLLCYVTRKLPREESDPDDIDWWEALSMTFHDGTSLMIKADGPRVDHDINESTTFLPKAGREESQTYFADSAIAGQA